MSRTTIPPQAAAAPVVAPLFELGRVFTTPGVLDSPLAPQVENVLSRHRQGDWGDMCDDDKAANELALKDGSRIFSAYKFPEGKLWVITEWDRSSTTVLLPSEY